MIINVLNLNYDYHGQKALDNVSFALTQNTITALVGPAGAGKTTLLKILAGLTDECPGKVCVDGVDILKDKRFGYSKIAWVPENLGLTTGLSVFETLWYQAAILNKWPLDRTNQVVTYARNMELALHLEQPVHVIPRSVALRLAVARALMSEPAFLLLDAPLVNLDIRDRQLFYTYLQKLKKEQDMTIILSTNILHEIEYYADKMMIMRDGKILKAFQFKDVSKKQAFSSHLKLVLAKKLNHLSEVLEEQEGIKNIQMFEDKTAFFDFNGSSNARAKILKNLIEEGASVVSLSEETQRINEIYMTTIENYEAEQ